MALLVMVFTVALMRSALSSSSIFPNENVFFEKQFLNGSISESAMTMFSTRSVCLCATACSNNGDKCRWFIFKENSPNLRIGMCSLFNSFVKPSGSNAGLPYFAKKFDINPLTQSADFELIQSFSLNLSTLIVSGRNRMAYFVSLVKDDNGLVLLDEKLSQSDAQKSCIKRGMTLVSIKTTEKAAELLEVWQLTTKMLSDFWELFTMDHVWTSGHFEPSKSSYVWADGSVTSVEVNWVDLFVSKTAHDMCLSANPLDEFNWQPYLCSEKFRYICEGEI